jgi:hypothetical protein
VHGRPPPLLSQEGHHFFFPIEAKLGGLFIVGRLAAHAAEAELETAEAELETAKGELETAKAELELHFTVLTPRRTSAII